MRPCANVPFFIEKYQGISHDLKSILAAVAPSISLLICGAAVRGRTISHSEPQSEGRNSAFSALGANFPFSPNFDKLVLVLETGGEGVLAPPRFFWGAYT